MGTPKYNVVQADDYVVLEVQIKNFNSQHAPDLKSELYLQSEGGFRNFIFDAKAVDYIDSSGLSTLLLGNRIAEGMNGLFVVCNVSEHVQKLIDIAQIGEVLEILPTRTEAVEAIRMHELERELSVEDPPPPANATRLGTDPA